MDDLYQIKKELKNVKMSGIDLDEFWEKFNMALALYKSAGGKMNYEDQLEIMLENINSTFYLDVIRKIRLECKNEEIDSKMFLAAKEALKDHFNATPQNIRNKFKENANLAEMESESANAVVRQRKLCDWCKKNKRWKIQNSHVKENCFYGDKPGWEKLVSDNKTVENSYFVAFHDSGSTPRSYFKDIPANCKKTTGFVQTADNKKVEAVGVGSAKFGNMELDDVAYVPSFTKNLVSGIQIMRQGYKQIIENNSLKIYKDDILVATGSYDSET